MKDTIPDPRDSRIDVYVGAGVVHVSVDTSSGVGVVGTASASLALEEFTGQFPCEEQLERLIRMACRLSDTTGIPFSPSQIHVEGFAKDRGYRFTTTHARLHADRNCTCFEGVAV